MTPRPAPTPPHGARSPTAQTGRPDEAELHRRQLRERAVSLLETAHQLNDLAARTGLIIEAALLHRLATIVEDQLAALPPRGLGPDAEARSFSAPRRPRLLH